MSLFQRLRTQVKYARPPARVKLVIGLFILLAVTVIIYHTTGDPKLFVVIVEEHHEVLPYWFEAAKSGNMPNSGFTLLHIDGHSDESAPFHIKDMPMFRWLGDIDDVGLYMQKNDVFIQAAVMAGLLSRVIFVWPSWSKTGEPHYTRDTVGLGYFMHRPPGESTEEPYFCECHSLRKPDEAECMFLNFTANNPDQDLPMSDQCKIQTTFISEHIIEDLAIKKLQSGKWIKPNESYILDIDEDYFGCESGSDPFVKRGVPWKVIEYLNKKLDTLLCPKSVAHEEAADTMLRQALELLMETCKLDIHTAKLCNVSFDIVNSNLIKVILEHFKLYGSMFCEDDDFHIRQAWKDIAFVLYHLHSPHIYLLLQTGFCLNTSPATLGFYDGGSHLQVCHGSNVPNETMVYLHSPSQNEIHHRMELYFSVILGSVPAAPELVTVCRSVRDGYTPRQHSMMIEWGIIKTLLNTFKEHDVQIEYDEYLLGGKDGWYGRYGGYPAPS